MDITTLFLGRSFKIDDSGRLSRGLGKKQNQYRKKSLCVILKQDPHELCQVVSSFIVKPSKSVEVDLNKEVRNESPLPQTC